MTRLAEAVVFITGANRGLGRALVDEFLARGASRVYAASRRDGSAYPSDPRVVPVLLDVTDADNVRRVAAACGETTILVNNAGINRFGSALDASMEDIAAEFEVNVFGPLDMIRTFAPVLAARRGSVVSILSICSMGAMPGLAGYSASKAAMASFHQSLVPVLASRGIRSHAVYPGPMDTHMNEGRGRDLFPPPGATARAVLDGIARGDAEIYPDARAVEVGNLWRSDPSALQKDFMSFL